jgi:hypothetical protein
MTSGGREEPVNVLAGEAAVTAVGCVGAAMGHAGHVVRPAGFAVSGRMRDPPAILEATREGNRGGCRVFEGVA